MKKELLNKLVKGYMVEIVHDLSTYELMYDLSEEAAREISLIKNDLYCLSMLPEIDNETIIDIITKLETFESVYDLSKSEFKDITKIVLKLCAIVGEEPKIVNNEESNEDELEEGLIYEALIKGIELNKESIIQGEDGQLNGYAIDLDDKYTLAYYTKTKRALLLENNSGVLEEIIDFSHTNILPSLMDLVDDGMRGE